MVMPNLAPAHTRVERLGTVGVHAVRAVRLGMIDPGHDITRVQVVPRRRFIGDDLSTSGDVLSYETECLGLGLEHAGDRATVALANDDDGAALAALIDAEPAILLLITSVGRST